jgi:Zn-dependent M28 family amino/carboxypeptidase
MLFLKENPTFTALLKFMMKKSLALLAFLSLFLNGFAQNPDSVFIKQIFDNALTNRVAYQNLEILTNIAPGRLVGSEESIVALKFFEKYFNELGADTVYLQEFKTHAWACDSSSASILKKKSREIPLASDALGTSLSTPLSGIVAEVIEVQGLEDLEKLGTEKISGKIVFFNRPMKDTFINTFAAYGDAVDQRAHGPAEAAKYGAAGAIVRSVTTSLDDFPHTGSSRFQEDVRIPALAISTLAANLLSEELKESPKTKIRIFVQSRDLPEITTYNLVAEIRGKVKPDEAIIVGGHIDSWFNSPGAHDDGAGCVMSCDVLRIFKELNIQNNRTIRVVLYMDEEMFQAGGNAYADFVGQSGKHPYLALEIDEGAFTPEGFTIDAPDNTVKKLNGFKPLLEPYGIKYIKIGGGGVDIYPLKKSGVPLVAYVTDPQRYFDLHHSANDTFDKINYRELNLGTGCVTTLIYLIDKYGVE